MNKFALIGLAATTAAMCAEVSPVLAPVKLERVRRSAGPRGRKQQKRKPWNEGKKR